MINQTLGCVESKCVEASTRTCVYIRSDQIKSNLIHNLVTNIKEDLDVEDSQLDGITVHIVVVVQWPKSNNSKE